MNSDDGPLPFMALRAWWVDPGKRAGARLDTGGRTPLCVDPESTRHAQWTCAAGGTLGWPSLW